MSLGEIGVGKLNITKYVDITKVSIAVVCIKSEAELVIKSELVATYAMRRENSLFCPSLKPTLQASSLCSSIPCNKTLNINGFKTIITIANVIAGINISLSKSSCSCAPSTKKKRIKKKSCRFGI